MKKSFGSVLRAERQKAGLYLKDVASKMGWSVVYLSDIERDRRNPPSLANIKKLAKIIGTPMEKLMDAACLSRQKVELPVNNNSTKTEVALLLARSWDGLSDDTAKKIKEILERKPQ